MTVPISTTGLPCLANSATSTPSSLSLTIHFTRDGTLRGVRVAKNSPAVNHLLFVDDTMFFCHATKENCQKLKEILEHYEIASGQRINKEKSSISFSGKTPQEVDMIKEMLDISKEGGQGKYLGLPEHFGRKKRDLFTAIVDRIRQRAFTRSNRFLSKAGKLTMLKSVLTAIPTYSMSCFELLARIVKGKYCHKQAFISVQAPGTCSHGWRSILHGRDLLKSLSRFNARTADSRVRLGKRYLGKCVLPKNEGLPVVNHPTSITTWRKPLYNEVHLASGAEFKDAVVAFKRSICLPPSGISGAILPWICWTLWTARNTLIFENRILTQEEVLEESWLER